MNQEIGVQEQYVYEPPHPGETGASHKLTGVPQLPLLTQHKILPPDLLGLLEKSSSQIFLFSGRQNVYSYRRSDHLLLFSETFLSDPTVRS